MQRSSCPDIQRGHVSLTWYPRPECFLMFRAVHGYESPQLQLRLFPEFLKARIKGGVLFGQRRHTGMVIE